MKASSIQASSGVRIAGKGGGGQFFFFGGGTMGKISILGHTNYVYSSKYSLFKIIVSAIDFQNTLHLHNLLMREIPWCGMCVSLSIILVTVPAGQVDFHW